MKILFIKEHILKLFAVFWDLKSLLLFSNFSPFIIFPLLEFIVFKQIGIYTQTSTYRYVVVNFICLIWNINYRTLDGENQKNF